MGEITIQGNLFEYFKDTEAFSLKEAEQLTKQVLDKEVKLPSIRARIYEGIEKGLFTKISRGVYKVVNKDVECILINGNGRDLSILKDNSIDAIITDHPYDIQKSHKGGNRDFASYMTFCYEKKDFEEKYRVLKDGSFLVEFLPEENGVNWEYINSIKQFAKECGFQYYAKVSWLNDSLVSNTGRKANNCQDLLFLTKGKARSLRLDTKKNKQELLKIGKWKNGLSSEQMKDILVENNIEVHYMSGTNGMLPTAFVYNQTKQERVHQAEKPVELYRDVQRYITKECEWVLDQFAGSFNLGKASIEEKRNSIQIELDEDIFHDAISRYEETGLKISEINARELSSPKTIHKGIKEQREKAIGKINAKTNSKSRIINKTTNKER